MVAVLLVSPLGARAEELAGKVTEVVKGDTVMVEHDGKTEPVRLTGIDCPELAQPFGPEAKQFTANLALQKDVTVETQGTDDAGRTLGVVKLPDGRILNRELAGAGMAWFYDKHAAADTGLRGIIAKAIAEKKGLWSSGTPLAPWDFRGDALKKKATDPTALPAMPKDSGQENSPAEAVFITKDGREYHRAGCVLLDKTKRVATRKEAEALGFSPCRICFPVKAQKGAAQTLSGKGPYEGVPSEDFSKKAPEAPAKAAASKNDVSKYLNDPIAKQVQAGWHKDANGNVDGISAQSLSSHPVAGPIAAMVGIQDGDVIQSINGVSINSEGSIAGLIEKYKNNIPSSVTVNIIRNGQPQSIPINVPAGIGKMF